MLAEHDAGEVDAFRGQRDGLLWLQSLNGIPA
jgi:hypothetical protein